VSHPSKDDFKQFWYYLINNNAIVNVFLAIDCFLDMTGIMRNTQKSQSLFACDDMVELYSQLPIYIGNKLEQRLVSDGECYLMEKCWFAGVNCDMKAEGVKF
jgi:hypothetical protein